MSFFGSVFKREKKGGEPEVDSKQSQELPYKKGSFIGQKYEVYGELGHGGFGIVYKVYSHETKDVYAMKTFKDEYLEDATTRELFRREANVWVDLERHPYIVRAKFVDEVSGRLYIGMEYIAPNERGLNSLQGYLDFDPPDFVQTLRWSIQFCCGIEYAYSKGVRCHRDIKPDNIMISTDKTVKITDFGLAGVLDASKAASKAKLNVQQGKVGLSGSISEGGGCGTPWYMPPEQFTNAAACDQRSDIYSFGIVLYQMASGGRLPFEASRPRDDSEEEQARFARESYRLHCQAPVPKLNSPLFPMICRCLEKDPSRRYSTFRELRADLEPLLKRQTGETIKPPELEELDAWEWINKGFSLDSLGRFDEAIQCYDQALEINPQLAEAWSNKGNCLHSLGRFDEAIQCYDQAININPQYADAWSNKGNSLNSLGRFEEAIQCCDKALRISTQDAYAWNNKGFSLNSLGRFEESIKCCNQALKFNPQIAAAWFTKGNSLSDLGRFAEAIECYDKALEINPQDADSWINKGCNLNSLGRFEEAIQCCDKALRISTQDVYAWNNKGFSLNSLGRFDEAINCYDRALKINPQHSDAWNSKGSSLHSLGRFEEAISCYDQALKISPQHALAWYNKGLAEDKLGRKRDAAGSFRKFIELAPAQYERQIEAAKQLLRELEGK